MNCCDYNCNQGRDCPARAAKHTELPITMEDDAFDYDWVMELVRDFFSALGFLAVVAVVVFYFVWR